MENCGRVGFMEDKEKIKITRDTRHTATIYYKMEIYVRQKEWSATAKYKVETKEEELLYKAEGKFLNNDVKIQSTEGKTLLKAEKTFMTNFPKYTITKKDGSFVASMHYKPDNGFNWRVIIGEQNYGIKHEVDIKEGTYHFILQTLEKEEIARTSKLRSTADYYRVSIVNSEEEQPELYAFMAVIIDQVCFEVHKRHVVVNFLLADTNTYKEHHY